ncbi:MAG TPA: MOSC N-terminal beta barrel domain-containing protein [Mycobacteriales bacterium]
MVVGTVVSLARYPVKSMSGESLRQFAVTARGVEADRVWAVYTADGRIGSGKTTQRFRRIDGLVMLGARMDGGRAEIGFPDGTTAAAGSPEADLRLSDLFGQPLSVRAETTVPHHDDCPVHLVTTASLRRLEDLLGEPVDTRRARPNLVLDVGGAGFLDNDWKGRDLRIGDEVVLRVGDGMPRCAMVTMAQPGLAHDARVLKLIAEHNDLDLGLQTTVLRAGQVRLGDSVRLT